MCEEVVCIDLYANGAVFIEKNASCGFSLYLIFMWRQAKQQLQEDLEKGKRGIPEGGVSNRHRNGRKQKMSYGHDVTSNDHSRISAN